MAFDHPDPYWKLRPAPATPEDEVCRCPPGGGVILCDMLGANPLKCLECRGEVPPERVGFDERFAEEIANWQSTHGSLYQLWLDSGEYEAWAAARLLDPLGQVNQQGRAIVTKLNTIVPAYYWWFKDTEAGEHEQAESCPVCAGSLKPFGSGTLRVCEACRIVL